MLTTITKQTKLIRPNLIAAQVEISESELVKVNPNYNYKEFTEDTIGFINTMHSLGFNTDYPIVLQENLLHRNRFGEVVKCNRWIGQERLDTAWIESGHASQEAIDKASGSRLLEDVYRARGLTEDAQIALEQRDRYYVTEESEE